MMNIPPLLTHIAPAPHRGAVRRGSTSTTRNKVVLFYPAYDGPALGPPLCILALAAPLLNHGFEVVMVDAAIDADAPQRILRECSDALCFGISVLTGPMISAALHISRMVKAALPDLPVIFGGWHPTLTAAQTLESDLVDVVVRGPGDLTLLELAQRYQMGEGLHGVAGLSYKEGGKIVHNLERSVTHLMDLPVPAFHLADFDAYERVSGIRKLTYATSVGCP